MLPMVNESARLLEEHVTDSTDTIDLATVMGLGSPFRGGIVNYANTIGIEQVVKGFGEIIGETRPAIRAGKVAARGGVGASGARFTN